MKTVKEYPEKSEYGDNLYDYARDMAVYYAGENPIELIKEMKQSEEWDFSSDDIKDVLIAYEYDTAEYLIELYEKFDKTIADYKERVQDLKDNLKDSQISIDMRDSINEIKDDMIEMRDNRIKELEKLFKSALHVSNEYRKAL